MDDLASLQGAIRDISDPMGVMHRVVEQALVLISSADGAVVELAQGHHLTYVCAAGTLAAHVGTRLPVQGSLSGWAVRAGQTVHCEDTRADERVDAESTARVGALSMICMPLRRGSESIGVLKVSSRRPRAFCGDDVATLARLAGFISTTIAAVSDVSRVTRELLASGRLPDGPASHNDGSPGAPTHGRENGDGISRFVANVLRPGMVANLAVKKRIERVLGDHGIAMVCQPIVDLQSGQVVGVEALARIAGPPAQPPDAWFADAAQAGLAAELQLAAVKQALELLDGLAAGVFLSVNVGPEAIAAPELAAIVRTSDPRRIVLELTEHLAIDDYPRLQKLLVDLRASGTRLAIDDTGAGFASLGHLVNLDPDLIKLDRQFTSGIDTDPVRRALATALVSFANDTGARVVAEGVETATELATIRQLGVSLGQGYFIRPPATLSCLPDEFPHIRRRIRGRRRVAPAAQTATDHGLN